MKVALVHDWLTGMRGGEKVLEEFAGLFPEADIFTLVWNKGSVSEKIARHKIIPSVLQKFPSVETRYRYYLALMPKIIERFDVSGYDLIISSSHCVAKGIKTHPGQIHISYCHTPMRYIWDNFDDYFSPGKNLAVFLAMKILRPYLQKWDVQSSQEINFIIANSKNVAERIKKYWGRESTVIYPPVDTDFYTFDSRQGLADYFLIVSALVPYKRIDLAVKTFNWLRYPLKIIGSGPEMMALKKIARSNIEFLGYQPNEVIRHYYRCCQALIFPGEEDFGIVPVEAQSSGRPVIAYKKGGALETIIENETGIFFAEQSESALAMAIEQFWKRKFNPEKIVANARKFSAERFRREIIDLVIAKENGPKIL